MDIFAKSVEISQEILKNYGVNLSIQKGDETVIVATIDVDTETVTIPDSQEAMLILDELGSIEQSVNLYLALKMLQNDDYDLCDELIGCLERESLSMCSDEDSLYKSILVKQLFVIFHEAGHYMISTNEEWKNYCINAFNEYIEEMNETRLDENDKSFMTSFSQDFDNEVKDYLEHELFRLDIRESSKNYMGRMHVPEETYADVTALMFLNDYIENLNFVGLRESLLGASFFSN